ncbi:uncharacterized protein LOC135398216 [Ornithodoros turicata]|uniref:uncharacterized protein LOC135398216 n=1 Tax=Ornithodoros turicata TaxID=34597 RepID=UPI003139ACEE
MEAKVFICILVFLLGVSHSAPGTTDKCESKRQVCPQEPTLLRRYFFDDTNKRCSAFFVCEGEKGDDFFPRMVDCVKDCWPTQKQPKCLENKLTECKGDSSGETAWTYDPQTNKCGNVGNACDGTKNKFSSENECRAERFGFDENGLKMKYRSKPRKNQ